MTESTATALSEPAAHLTQSYDFTLPPELIAREPLAERAASRLLVVDPLHQRMADYHISELPQLLRARDVMIFNNTRVLAARLFGKKLSGGAIEILIERVLDSRTVLAQMGVSKKPRVHQEILLEDGTRVVVAERAGLFWRLKLMGAVLWPQVIAKLGHVPLPPYLERDDAPGDRERYQTVYAKTEGSVAAPTAGLHFDAPLLAAIDARGVQRFELTLHVGAGTFSPLRVSDLREHQMHSEQISVPGAALAALGAASAAGARRICVGTTSLRALESVPLGHQGDFVGETDIFIRPGYPFSRLDGLLTNFHLPRSTLLVLLCAFGGRELILNAYQHAIAQRYRFYSYGDAMLVLPGALEP